MSALSEKRAWVLGAGTEARAYLEALRGFPEITPTFVGACVDEAERQDRVAPDLAVVCGDAATRDVGLRLLRGGSDLIVDAPLADGPAQVDALAALAEAAGRAFLSGGARCLAPCWQVASRHLAEGRIGRLREVEWLGGPKAVGEPELRERVAAVAVLERLAGPIDRIRWRVAGSSRGVIETTHHSGASGSARFDADSATQVVCRGEQGELRIGEAQTVWVGPEGSRVCGPGLDDASGYREAWAELLRRRRAAVFTEDEGAFATVRVLEATAYPDCWRAA